MRSQHSHFRSCSPDGINLYVTRRGVRGAFFQDQPEFDRRHQFKRRDTPPTSRLLFRIGLIALLLGSTLGNGAWGREPLEVYTDAANFQNNGILELAVQEWERFLIEFPDHELSLKARYYLGVSYFQLKTYDQAAEAFQQTIKQAVDIEFDLLEDAYLNLGSSQFALARAGKSEMYAQAVQTYAQLLELFPVDKGKYGDQALYFMGDAWYAQGNKQQAVIAYARLISEYPTSPTRADGLFALAATFDGQAEYEKSVKYYQMYIDEFPQASHVDQARMAKAEMLVQLKQFAEAGQKFAALADRQDFDSADMARFRQAFCAWQLNDFATAAQLYATVAQMPQSAYVRQAALMTGRSHYRTGNLDQARQWFGTVIEQGGDEWPEAAHWQCRVHLAMNEPQQALQVADQVLPQAEQSDYYVNLLMDRADALYEFPARRPEAQKLYLQIDEQHSDHPLAPHGLYGAIFTALDLKKYQEGVVQAELFATKYPENDLLPDVRHTEAECRLMLGDQAAAEAIYRQITAEYTGHTHHTHWLVRLGYTLFLQQKFAETVTTLQPQLSQIEDPQHTADAMLMTGASLFHQKQYQHAAASLQAALERAEHHDKSDEVLLYLARAQRELNQFAESLQSLEKLLGEYPESSYLESALYWYGENSFALKDYDTAAQKYLDLIESRPESENVPHAWSGRGWCGFRLKQYDVGIASFSELINKHPQHEVTLEANYGRALCYYKKQDYEHAIEDLDTYLKTDPPVNRRSNALYLRGLSLIETKRYEDAVQSLTTLLNDSPEYASADRVKYQLAWTYKLLNQRPDAVQWFTKITLEHDQSAHVAEAFYHLAENAYWHEHDYAVALDNYQRCRRLAADEDLTEKAIYMEAWCKYQQKEFAPAHEQFSHLLENYPQGAHARDAQFMQSESLFRLERFDDAIQAYQQIIGQENVTPERRVLALLHSGQSAIQLEQWETGLQLLEQISAGFPASRYLHEAMFEQGVCLFNLGRQKSAGEQSDSTEFDESMKLFDSVATSTRGALAVRARFHMGEVYFQKKLFINAVRQYQRVMYGFGGDQVSDEVKGWQARAGFQAGQAVLVLAGDTSDFGKQERLIKEGEKYFRFVVDKAPNSKVAVAAEEKLKRR